MLEYSSIDISELINALVSNKICFACYRLPYKEELLFKIFRSENTESPHEISTYKKGFLFHPFTSEGSDKTYLLYPESSFSSHSIPIKIQEIIKKYSQVIDFKHERIHDFIDISKNEYLDLVQDAIDIISTGELEKIVMSRQIYNQDITINKAGKYLMKLSREYKTAFIYFLNLPGATSWLGATPELFLSGNKDNYQTVSLAGTSTNSNINWGEKEITEQAIVSEYIIDELKKINIANISMEGPQTFKAGNVYHLQTKFKFTPENNTIEELIKTLHPTPAVCGTPKKLAQKKIELLEVNKREYYSGLVGFIDENSETNLFVNLRCLQFIEKGCILYAGGGITIDSDPEKEWEETCYKAQTLLSVLEKI